LTSKNDITGDKQQSRVVTEAYRNNYDKVFKKTGYKQNTTAIREIIKHLPKLEQYCASDISLEAKKDLK
jgi:hypothetical protein